MKKTEKLPEKLFWVDLGMAPHQTLEATQSDCLLLRSGVGAGQAG
ncbi:MAG: hypothetical protein U5L95_02290 [Candidatus Saccharibacteria bacterium]|nr:hypothetical protein [Candidatus Saccharibacteria bacterium]